MNRNSTHKKTGTFISMNSGSVKSALASIAELYAIVNKAVSCSRRFSTTYSGLIMLPVKYRDVINYPNQIIISNQEKNKKEKMIKNIAIIYKSKASSKSRHLNLVLACFLLTITGAQILAQSGPVINTEKTAAVSIVQPGVNISESTKEPVVAGAYAAIGDFVWIDNNANGKHDAGEPGLPNVEVVLYDSLLNVIDSKYTNEQGHYHFSNIPIPASGSGTYIVGFNNIPPGYAYTKLVSDSLGNIQVSKSDTISGRTKPFVLIAGDNRSDIDGGVKTAPGVVLPLILNQFNGNYADGFIQLGWSTYSEININHFNVERSTDGINFRQNGRINVEGGLLNSNLNYTFLDITALRGTNYYRLAIVDVNGNYTYSKTIMINVDIKGISVMVVYPNPFSRRVKIRVNCDKAEKVAINVLNNDGLLMNTILAETTVGDNNIDITKVESLPAGIYFIEVVSSTRRLKTKVMKLN